jgi:hypothetical protein
MKQTQCSDCPASKWASCSLLLKNVSASESGYFLGFFDVNARYTFRGRRLDDPLLTGNEMRLAQHGDLYNHSTNAKSEEKLSQHP